MTTMPLFTTERGDWQPTTDDRYTPPFIFEAMELEFDLDVASPPGGIPWIPAKRYYTIHDDGLAQPWEGLVWCNPPFSAAAKWAEKFREHANGVWLGPVSNAKWPARLYGAADLVWIPPNHFDFLNPTGRTEGISYLVVMCAFAEGAVGLRRLQARLGGTLLTAVEA